MSSHKNVYHKFFSQSKVGPTFSHGWLGTSGIFPLSRTGTGYVYGIALLYIEAYFVYGLTMGSTRAVNTNMGNKSQNVFKNNKWCRSYILDIYFANKILKKYGMG